MILWLPNAWPIHMWTPQHAQKCFPISSCLIQLSPCQELWQGVSQILELSPEHNLRQHLKCRKRRNSPLLVRKGIQSVFKSGLPGLPCEKGFFLFFFAFFCILYSLIAMLLFPSFPLYGYFSSCISPFVTSDAPFVQHHLKFVTVSWVR